VPTSVLSRPGPPDEEWVAAAAALHPAEQVEVVVAKLRELNPEYDGRVMHYVVEGRQVMDLGLHTDTVSDIRPLAAFRGLRHLTVIGTKPGKGKLIDLSPVRGMKLTNLNCWQNPGLADLSPARGMRITLLQAGDTAIEDLTPLEGMPLHTLALNNCRVRDLTPIKTMRVLRFLRCDGCPISTLAPLKESTLLELYFTLDAARGDIGVIGEMSRLYRVNGGTIFQFRRKHGLPE
jgi:hypothetical protein